VAEPDALERLRNDPGLRAVVETARAWGVSPRRFSGWEPAVTVTPLQGGGWRVVREPEWDDESQELALALAAYEADLCPGCRQPLSETTLPEREGRYKAQLAVRCHRCTASSIGADVYAETPHAQALLLPVELVPPPD
jgi:hypothetical protein